MKSLALEGEAREKRRSAEAAAVEGMKTGEEVEAEGRTRWGEAGEVAPCPLRRCRWLRRSRVSLFSQGGSGNPGTEWHCPVAAGPPGVCPLRFRRSSCDR